MVQFHPGGPSCPGDEKENIANLKFAFCGFESRPGYHTIKPLIVSGYINQPQQSCRKESIMRLSDVFVKVIRDTEKCTIYNHPEVVGKKCLAVRTEDVNKLVASFIMAALDFSEGNYKLRHNLLFSIRILLNNMKVIEEGAGISIVFFPAYKEVTYEG